MRHPASETGGSALSPVSRAGWSWTIAYLGLTPQALCWRLRCRLKAELFRKALRHCDCGSGTLFDIDSHSVRDAAVNLQHNIHLASARQCLGQKQVELIQTEKPALRARVPNFNRDAGYRHAHAA